MIRDATLPLELSTTRYSTVQGYLVATFAKIRYWCNVYRQRRILLVLDDAILKDIGFSRTDALAEGSKPFWRP